MNTPHLTLSPLGVSDEQDWRAVSWRLEADGHDPFTLSHALAAPHHHLLPDLQRGDHALAATLLWAMRRGLDIRVEGEVSPKLLDGLDTLQSIWQRWRPNRYRRVTIHVSEEAVPTAAACERPALFAFSGGVDASFSFFRHLRGDAGRNNCKPGAGLLVHGMDIPLDQPKLFDNASARAQRILAGTSIPLLRLRTNSKHLRQDWEDSFGLQFGACFLFLQAHFAHSVLGSGEPYNTLVMPWGSSPLTDPLCRTEILEHHHDGCAFDRTEKVAWLAHHTAITADLRVCWEGEQLDRNCGKCEKCIRTMLNFWAAGVEVPAAFPTPLSPPLVSTLRINNEVQLRELKSLFGHADTNRRQADPIYAALQSVLRKASLRGYKDQVAYLVSRIVGSSRRRL